MKWFKDAAPCEVAGPLEGLIIWGVWTAPLIEKGLTYKPKYGGKSLPPTRFLGPWVGWHRHMNVGYDELQVKRFHACPPDCLSTFQIYKWILKKNNHNWNSKKMQMFTIVINIIIKKIFLFPTISKSWTSVWNSNRNCRI